MIAKHLRRGREVTGNTPSGKAMPMWLAKGEKLPVAAVGGNTVVVETADGSLFALPRQSVQLFGRRPEKKKRKRV